MTLWTPFAHWTIRGRWWPVTLRRHQPADAVVIHHAVTPTAGRTDLRQAQDVEAVIYGRRLRSRFSMVAYNYLVSTGARLYEGRGTTYRNGANNDTKGTGLGNANTLSVVLAGNYHDGVLGLPALTPTDAQARIIAALIVELIHTGDLVPTPHIVPHRHVHATACPGSRTDAEWFDTVRRYVTASTTPTPPPPSPPSQELPDMHLIRLASGLGALDWLEHGGTISALEVATSDRLAAAGIPRTELEGADVPIVAALRNRWFRHGILDESTASRGWVDFATAIGLADAGRNSV